MTASFRAMTTEVTLWAPTLGAAEEAAAAARVAALFAHAERRFSRFAADSELAGLNRATGPMVVSAPLFDALVSARAFVDATDGAFDPGIGAALRALGYDRSVAAGPLDRDRPSAAGPRASLRELELDVATRTVRRPAHLHIDLGGLIKGRTVDAAAGLLPVPAAIDAGGDAVLRGADPDHGAWLVDVEDPADADAVLLTLRVADRAVATSAGNRRRWRCGGDLVHHLVDPRTGRAACTDLAQVTVVAATAELAEVLAKAAFIQGRAVAIARLAAWPGVGAVLVGHDGRLDLVGDVELAGETAAEVGPCGDR